MDVIEGTCTGCGERNPANTEFCLFCGDYLGWDQASNDAATTRAEPSSSRPSEARVAQQPVTRTESASAQTAPSPPAAPSTGGGAVTADVPVAATASQAGVPDPPDPAPRGAGTAQAGPGFAAQELSCPACAAANVPERRLCVRCGATLRQATNPAISRQPAARPSAWRRFTARFTDPEEAAARRAYRRSLPGLLRWRRRAIVGLVILGVGGGVATAMRGNPVPLLRDMWYDQRGDFVQVAGVKAAIVPATSQEGAADALTDGSAATSWTTAWAPGEGVPNCEDPHGTARVQLTFPETAVREIRLITGVTDPSRRSLELLPAAFYVIDDRNLCSTFEAGKGDGVQRFRLNSDQAISQLTIGISTTHPATDERAEEQVSLSEISLWQHPG